jgi:Fe-S cluster biogenesis protein NfuA
MFPTEPTPNPNALKFIFNNKIVGEGSVFYDIDIAQKSDDFIKDIFRIAGVRFILLQDNYMTITKYPQWTWNDMTMKVKELMLGTDFYIESGSVGEGCDDEICCAVGDIIAKEIQPAVNLDGGDVKFIRFKDGVVEVKMQGSCFGCPNHEATLGALYNKLHSRVPEVQIVKLV